MSDFTVEDLSSFTHTELAKSLIESEKDRELAVERATNAEECAAEALSISNELLLANAKLVVQLAELRTRTRTRTRSRSWSFFASLCGGSE